MNTNDLIKIMGYELKNKDIGYQVVMILLRENIIQSDFNIPTQEATQYILDNHIKE